MDCSTPGFPVHNQLLEPTQTHVHQVSDAIQPSHLLSSPAPPTFNLPQHQSLFQWVSSLHQVAKVLEFQQQHQGHQMVFKSSRSCLAASVHCLPHCSSANTRILLQQLLIFAFLNWVCNLVTKIDNKITKNNESAVPIKWPKYWSFSFSRVLPMNVQGWFPLGLTGLISLVFKGLSRGFASTTVQKHQFFGSQPSLLPNCYIHTWLLKKP